jgi:tetratricopeptide (TPR) repeat protein
MNNKAEPIKPTRTRTVITIGLMIIWASLISFTFISAIEPAWLKNIAQVGRKGEADGMKEYGDYYLRQKDYPMAIAQYKTALKIKPDLVGAMVNMAVAYNLSGNGEQGLAFLQSALKLNSRRTGTICYNLAEILQKQGKTKEALEYYLKALNSDAKQDLVNCMLGALYFDAKNYGEARKSFENALVIQSNPVTPLVNMIKVAISNYEDDKDNLPVLEQMLKDDVDTSNMKNYDLKTIEAVNESNSAIAKIHNYLGAICAIQGDTLQAIKHFRESNQIWPNNVDAINQLKLLTGKK